MTAVAAQSMFEIVPGSVIGSSSASAPVRVLMLQASSEGIKLSTVNSTANDGNGNTQIHTFAPGWSGLLMLDRTVCNVIVGRGVACVADLAALAKLQAFLDAGRALVDGAAAGQSANHVINHGAQTVAVAFREQLDGRDWRAVESWFMKRSVYAEVNGQIDSDADVHTDFDCFAAALRSTEYYKLVQFLLGQPASRSMQELSAIYGLSYSHFRKLCREALGRGGKAEFQQWRNVRALLDMVDMGEQGGSLTDVALRQGFASSSHFSDAMKNQFGISPRYLMRALDTE
jgi:AraC-like DNA-binding protein